MSSKGGSFSRIGFHVGTDGRVWCHTYADATPILDIDNGGSSVGISVSRTPDKATVEFAKALADEARKFADEMERLHAAQLDDDTKAAGSNAA